MPPESWSCFVSFTSIGCLLRAWSRIGAGCRGDSPGTEGHWSSARTCDLASARTVVNTLTMETKADPVRVYLLDDHQIVRRGLRDLSSPRAAFEVVGESGSAVEAPSTAFPPCSQMSRSSTPGCPTAAGSTCAATSGRSTRVSGPDPDVVRRRRGAVRGDHGRRRRLRPQADRWHGPRGRGPPGRERPVDARSAVTQRVLERVRYGSANEPDGCAASRNRSARFWS